MQKIGRNDPCWCGSGHKYKNCHMDFDVKLSEYRHKGSKVPSHAMIKNPEQIAAIRESAKINVSVLDYVAEHICAGISTEQIDLWVYEQTTHRGGIPAPLNYEGFPKSVNGSTGDGIIMDQRISRFSAGFQCFPEGLIVYHKGPFCYCYSSLFYFCMFDIVAVFLPINNKRKRM